MIRLIGLVVSIGIADSLNPTTIAPALYLAAGDHARRQVAEFTAAVFARLSLRRPGHRAGAGRAAAGDRARGPGATSATCWRSWPAGRCSSPPRSCGDTATAWPQAEAPEINPRGRSSAILGATITAVELPTAFPVFRRDRRAGGRRPERGPHRGPAGHLQRLLHPPLLAILGVLTFAGTQRAARAHPRDASGWRRGGRPCWRSWRCVAGLIVTLLGVTGLASAHHNDFGTFSRRFRKALHLHP